MKFHFSKENLVKGALAAIGAIVVIKVLYNLAKKFIPEPIENDDISETDV